MARDRVAEARVSDDESLLVAHLRRMSREKEGTSFTIARGAQTFSVSYSGGSSSSLTFTCSYDTAAKRLAKPGSPTQPYRASQAGGPLTTIRPMMIALRTESVSDVAAKESGVNREHQTGDARFDSDVYVDTATEDAILSHVLGEEVRRAVLGLFAAEMRTITIDDAAGNVTAYTSDFVTRDGESGVLRRAEAMVSSFAAMLDGLPIICATGEVRELPPLTLLNRGGGVLAVVAGLGMIPGYFAMADLAGCMEYSEDSDGDTSGSVKDACGSPGLVALAPLSPWPSSRRS